MAVDSFALGLLLAAFAGGAFGAAIGALPAFVFTGVLVLLGEVQRFVPVASGSVQITNGLAFGVFGPHVTFAGGAAAVAYAVKRGYIEPNCRYHDAKCVIRGLGTRPDVLAVGGVFGAIGHLAAAGSSALSIPWDPVAFGVVVSALAHRIVLGYSIFGAPLGRLLDMTPYERAVVERATDGGQVEGGRFTVEPWLPYQYRWSHVSALGIVVGILGGYIAYVTASPFLAFGVSVTTLIFLIAGGKQVPVTHHITLPASTAALALVGVPASELTPAAIAAAVPLWQALAIGALFGLVGALAGELAQRVLYAHSQTHLDPPAVSIVVTSLFVALLAMVGVLPSAVWVPVS